MKKDFYELTNPQKSIWYTEEVFKGTPIANITATVIIPQKVDFKLLERAINILIEKADSYRLKFFLKNDTAYQYVEDYSNVPLEVIEVTSNEDLQKKAKEIADTPFDVLNSFLFDFRLVKFPDCHGGFIIRMHHLISDAWSGVTNASEILKFYSLLLKGEDTSSIEYPSYTQYIKSEQEYIQSEKFNKDKAFWNDLFENVPEIASIPTSSDFSKTTSVGASIRKQFNFSNELVNNINTFCKNKKISVFNFFTAIFAIYLSRVSSLDEFVIGTPILNRTNIKEKRTSGMFINTIPLKISLKENIKFSELASSISSSLFNMFKHQKYSYLSLLEDLRHTTAISSLYDVFISYQNVRSSSNESDIPFDIEWIHNNYTSDSLDIHIFDMNDSGSFNISYDYQTMKYSESDILDIHKRIISMINQILENTEILVDNIKIVTPEEEHKLLVDFNNHILNYDSSKSIKELFEAQVIATPDNTALVYKNDTLSYSELNEKANILSNYLIEKGIKKGDTVPVFLNRSIDLIISMLGIIKSGAVYLPISKDYPLDRVRYILENSNSKLLLTSSDFSIDENNVSTIFIDKFDYNTNFTQNPNIKISADDVLYIIYTSGSTGNPKGAKLTNQNLNNFVSNFQNYFGGIDSSDRCLASTNIGFDVSIFEFFVTLISGATLYLYEENTITDIFNYCKEIAENNITLLYIPPNILEEVYSILSTYNHVSINKMLIGVEPILSETIKKYYNLNKNIIIVNAYGPTETTICSTAIVLNKKILNSYHTIPIGMPLKNLKLFVLDKKLKPVPIATPGELYITGDNVGKGYLNNSELTEKSFIKLPQSLSSAIAYKTGDLVKWNPDGTISFISRKDNQVKINGHRIELGEIENCICKFPEIEKSVVLVDNKQKLTAYFTSKKDTNISELRAFLQKKLPSYFIPNTFVKLEKFNLTSNGKIDKKALAKIKSEVSVYKAPTTDFQKRLAKLFGKVLDTSNVSVNDNFFEIGGDSLSAIKLCIQIQTEFNVRLSVKDILENPVLKNLSDVIEKSQNTVNEISIKPVEKMDFYPLSSAQKRIYLASTIAGENSILYNIPGGIILDKMPDISKLEACLNTLISRHESLRTHFDIVDNNIVQKIDDTVIIKLQLSKETISYKKLHSRFKDFVKPFDLSKAPLFRVQLIKLNNHKVALFVDIHHIISDGASMHIFIDELCKLYNNQVLETASLSYKDFAVWERNALSSNEFNKLEQFWVNQFNDDIPVLNMPTNYARPINKSYLGNKVHFSIDKNTADKLNNLASSLKVTPYMLLLSAYYILLKKYSMQNDIIVGTPVAARTIPDLENIIGMFVNTLPLRVSIDSKKSFKDLLHVVKSLCLNAFKHQNYPFDELVSKLNIQRDNGRNPIFDTMFIYQNSGLEELKFFGINSTYYTPDTNVSKFDLSLEIIPNKNGLSMSFEYACDLFNKEFITEMSTHYINILNIILNDTSIRIADIDMLSSNEKFKLLHTFNNTSFNFNKTQTISELFEAQVAKSPKKIALVFENNKISYQNLNEKANSLAHYLERNGITRNDVVGILENRSIEMIISILAVLKAGGTYILIDNALPAHRVKYMLTNSNAKLLLIDSDDYSVEFSNQFNISNFDYSTNTENLKCNNQLFDSFSIIYTSGSTGNPKGVLLAQSGLINLVYSFDKIMKLGNFSSHLGVSSVSFDMFAVELYSSLLLGRTLYLLNAEEIKNPVLMSKIIIDNKVEFLITTPTKVELLLQNQQTAKCLKVLKSFQLGGEVFSSSLYERLSKYTNAKIYNGYGPTEITACCSNKLVTSKSNINIGTPIPNTEIYILNDDMNICPINVPGELCVAGKGLSLGYVNDKVKTSNAFVNVKFTNKKLYKTGDIAKYLPNGEIEYIGRNDFQVKLNGLRIELSEIERKLLDIPEISSCTVLCDKSKTFLKAFFTSKENLSIPAIRKKLLESLPDYMIPKYIFQIDSIPMTPNGKVDRKTLDAHKISLSKEKSSYVEPETDMQKLFCNIWESILGTKIGIDNDLFELGADSLSAIKFKVEALNNNIDVPYADIFKLKTIRKLATSNHTEENVTTPLDTFDYTGIDSLLKHNKRRLKYNINTCVNNNILLFGSNGFVGMHIIDSFIKNDNGIIYCIMRDKSGKGSLNRFLEVLHFYFGKTLDKYIDDRIIVMKGDIVKENFGLSNKNYEEIISKVSIVINAAANVKHFGNFDKFKNINIDASSRAIEFCKKYSKRLIHLSTLSVSGNMFLDGSMSYDSVNKSQKVSFAESNLFINQSLDNVYTRSKFEAEKIILDNISKGLDAQVLRLGNITSRASDGKFQINPESNAFVNRLKAFISLGAIPKSLVKQEIEFTPVDKCSEAIIRVAQNKCPTASVLHIYNRNHSTVEKVLKGLNTFGFSIKVLDDNEFANFIDKNLSNKSFKQDISGIINDLNLNKKLSYTTNISIKSDFSVDFLLHCGFKWNKINETYIIKYITYLKSIGYLDKEEDYDISN